MYLYLRPTRCNPKCVIFILADSPLTQTNNTVTGFVSSAAVAVGMWRGNSVSFAHAWWSR